MNTIFHRHSPWSLSFLPWNQPDKDQEKRESPHHCTSVSNEDDDFRETVENKKPKKKQEDEEEEEENHLENERRGATVPASMHAKL